jgi:hypothetical protein
VELGGQCAVEAGQRAKMPQGAFLLSGPLFRFLPVLVVLVVLGFTWKWLLLIFLFMSGGGGAPWG